MIINDTIKIKVYNQMVKYYKEKGYNVPYNGSEINIKITDLPNGSSVKIDCKCDICNSIKKLPYCDYLQSLKVGGYYTCQKCHHIKSEKTNLDKYGCNISSLQIIKDKKKETCLKNWGVEHPMMSKDIIKKSKETNLKKYGVEYYTQTKEYKRKSKITCLEKYGVEYPLQNKIVKDKNKTTNINRYGCNNVFENEKIKEKIKQTNLEKYGFDNYSKTYICKTKVKNTMEEKTPLEKNEMLIKYKTTNLKKYGVEYPQQNINIFNKQQKSGFNAKRFKDSNIHYRGTYELDFLEKYYDKINIKNGMTIRYNENKVYFPDFYFPKLNLIIEIKSEYTYKLHETKNLNKQKSCLEQGYNFIFIIDKDYTEFEKIIF